MIHIWRPWKLSNFQDPPLTSYPSTSKILPPPWPWASNFKGLPLPIPLQMITNKLKENNPRTKLSYDIRSFLQVGFRFQYQLINLAWLSFDFFSFTLKIFTIFHDFSWFFLFFLDFFSIFHDTVMIYNTRN